MAEGQRELLDRLRINRDDDDDEDGPNRWLIIGGGAIGVLLVVFAIYAFWPSSPVADDAVAASETPAAASTANAATGTTSTGAPGASAPTLPASGGVLSASGYVTARRLATVSAEITG